MFASLFGQYVNDVMLVKLIVMREQMNTTTLRVARMNKAKFMNICHHVPITASHIADLFKIDTNNFNSSTYPK